MSNDTEEIVKSSILVSVITGFNLLLGFAGQVLIAYYFGTSGRVDLYFVALALPSVLIGASRAVFAPALIPVVMSVKESENKTSKIVFASFVYAIIIAVALSFIGFLSRENILLITTSYRDDSLNLTARLAAFVWLMFGSTVLVSFLNAVHRLNKYFVLPAVVSSLPVIGRIIGVVLFAKKLDIMSLIIGEAIFWLLSVIVLLPVMFKYFRPLRLSDLRDSHTLDVLKAIFPVMISLVPFTILPTIDAFWASKLPPGSMSYLSYAGRMGVALSVAVQSGIYIVILPYLSEYQANGKHELFMSRLIGAIKAVLFFIIPMSIFGIFYREQLIEVLFKRGMFNEESAKGVASVLPFYLIGLIGMVPATLLSQAYFAKKMFYRFGFMSISFVILYFVAAGVLSSRFSYFGIGAAYIIYWFLFFIVGVVYIGDRFFSAEFVRYLANITAVSLGSSIVSYLLVMKLLPWTGLPALLSGLSISVIMFLLFCYIFRFGEVISVVRGLRNRQPA